MARRASAEPRPSWPYRGRALDHPSAVALQEEGRRAVRCAWSGPEPRFAAGADVAVGGGRAHAALVVFALPSLEPIEQAVAERPLEWPYLPGLLAFREVPALVAAFERLRRVPDVILVDGHGRAHPRRYGVASMLGVELDVPTIGVGKSLLVGTHREPRDARGASCALVHEGETIGRVLRTRAGVAPVFVSIGHRIDLARAEAFVLRWTRGFRLPEPIRAADRAAGRR